jgi:hypothetical protein
VHGNTEAPKEQAHFLNLIEEMRSIKTFGRGKESQEQGATGDLSNLINWSRHQPLPYPKKIRRFLPCQVLCLLFLGVYLFVLSSKNFTGHDVLIPSLVQRR